MVPAPNSKSGARGTILTLLKRRGGMTVPEMAGELGISSVAIRKHLALLDGEGLIAASTRAGQRGRPAVVYHVSEAGEAHFPQGYHQLVVDLLQDVAILEGEQKLEHLFRQRNERLAQSYELRLQGKPLKEAVHELARVRDDDGYMTSVEESDRGIVLAEHNCPIIDVAQRFPQACHCEQQLFERLLGASVRREATLAEGAAACRYHIETRVSPG